MSVVEIPLTRGKVALVDTVDYEYLSQWKWCARQSRKSFYACRNSPRVRGKKHTIHMHRVVAQRMGLNFQFIDHINRDSLDNRRDNLRPVTNKQNLENRRLQANNLSGHTGVCWDKQLSKWRVGIGHNGRSIYIGVFDNLDDAILSRKEAEQKYFTHTGESN